MFVALFLVQGRFYFWNVVRYRCVVVICAGLSALLFCEMAYVLSGIVVVNDSFELGYKFWWYYVFAILKYFVRVSTRGCVVPCKGAQDRRHVQSEHDFEEKTL